MPHGTDQAILGLGDGSDAPNGSPVATGANNTLDALAGGTADDITVDSTSVIGTGTDVQTVLEDITAEFTSPTHTHTGGQTTVKVASDIVIAGGVGVATVLKIPMAANEIYEFEFAARWTGIDNGDSASLVFSQPAGSTFVVLYSKIDGASAVTHGGGVDVASCATIGTNDFTGFQQGRGIVTCGATPGDWLITADAGGAATLKEGSMLRFERTGT